MPESRSQLGKEPLEREPLKWTESEGEINADIKPLKFQIEIYLSLDQPNIVHVFNSKTASLLSLR